jgi:hypothetical protein
MKFFKENFWEQVFIKVTSSLIVSLITSILTIVVIILISIYDPLKIIIKENVSLTVLIIFILILILLLALSTIYVFYLRKQLKPNLITAFGVYWDNNVNAYCPSCKTMLTNYAFYDTGRKHQPGIKCISCEKLIHFSDENKRFYDLGEAKQIVQEIFNKKK